MNGNEATEPEEIDPEIVREEHVTLRHPSVPATLDQLAYLKGQAIEITHARAQVLQTLRSASIQLTSPEDWLLFKSSDGRVTGYLADSGAERIRKLYGIEIFNVSEPIKVPAAQEDEFYYLVRGDGRCNLTGEVIEAVEGGRGSGEAFCDGKKGVHLELAVRKAARANLDGSIVRELSGLSSVPIEELKSAWRSTPQKKSEHCRFGKGFGTKQQRQGAQVQEGDETKDPGPKCPICNSKMNFRKAGRTSNGKQYPAFWGCSRWQEGCKGSIQDSEYQQSKRFATIEPELPREPGEEG